MKWLEETILPQRKNERRKVFILYGLGGIGKTQLSVEFARRHWRKFSSTFWLDGRTEDSLKRSITAVANQMPKNQVPRLRRSYTHASGGELNTVIRNVLGWLSLDDNRAWLLIIDSVDKDYLSAESDPGAYDIKQYFPGADHGSILLTTRLASLGQLGCALKVDKINEVQAQSLMTNSLDHNSEGKDRTCECSYTLFL